jgi:lysozyme family protein
MTPLFNKCIQVVLQNEGGYQCDPDDLGNWTGPNRTGELRGTKYGIAARFFPKEDIKNLSKDRAMHLYYWHYWRPMNLEGLHNELSALHIFDMGVNAGKGRAIRMAQRLVGVKIDGVFGLQSTAAVNNFAEFVEEYKAERRAYYVTIAKGKNAKFLNGWLNRVEKTKL